MKKSILIIITVISLLVVTGLACYNAFCYEEFWDISISSCLSLIIAIVISFYFVQRRTDQRKQREIFIKLLESLMTIVDDPKVICLSDIPKEEILMNKRAMNSKIGFIAQFGEKFNISKEIAFIEEKFKEYDSIIGDHIDDRNTLGKLHNQLRRPLSLISQKIFEIMMNLYN